MNDIKQKIFELASIFSQQTDIALTVNRLQMFLRQAFKDIFNNNPPLFVMPFFKLKNDID